MKINQSRSLRKCIDTNCKTCIYDPKAAGTWRQQVTLCTVTSCAFYPVRPVTKAPIPDSVLNYYGASDEERVIYGRSRPQEGRFNDRERTDLNPTIQAA